ncbi:winged helix-turn-helix domain-containing protein [Tepidimicrobium xylanilyticum]
MVFTKTEFDIIELLSTHPNMIFDREKIYSSLWGL